MKRTPIRRVSKKLAARKAVYRKVVAAWLPLHPWCEIGPVLHKAGYRVRCKKITEHPHHVRGRTGDLLTDTRYFKASCGGECHPAFIHNNPGIARQLGLLE